MNALKELKKFKKKNNISDDQSFVEVSMLDDFAKELTHEEDYDLEEVEEIDLPSFSLRAYTGFGAKEGLMGYKGMKEYADAIGNKVNHAIREINAIVKKLNEDDE
jgi:hypothetical protein